MRRSRKLKILLIIAVGLAVILADTTLCLAAGKTHTGDEFGRKKTELKLVRASSTSVRISWKKVEDASGYEIFKAGSDGKFVKLYTTRLRSTVSIESAHLKPGSVYAYKVRAFREKDGKREYTAFSEKKRIRVQPVKAGIEDAYSKGETNCIYIKYRPSPGASGFEYQLRYRDCDMYDTVTTNSSKDVNQRIEVSHHFRGDGKWTGWSKTYTTSDSGGHACKKGFEDISSLTVKLKKKYEDNGYYRDVRYSGMSYREEILKKGIIRKNEASINLDIPLNRIYEFRVRAYRMAGGNKVYGLWSDAFRLCPKTTEQDVRDAIREYIISNYPDTMLASDEEFEEDFRRRGGNLWKYSWGVEWGSVGTNIYTPVDRIMKGPRFRETGSKYGGLEEIIDSYMSRFGSGYIYVRRIIHDDKFESDVYYECMLLS